MRQEEMMRALLTQADSFEEIQAEVSGSMVRVFRASYGGGTVGYIVELAPSGYGGRISMVVGVSSADSTLAGMRVLRHSETPGLGSVISAARFYDTFTGRQLNPLTVVRGSAGDNEIDAITSATITTVAVTNAVNEAIEWYNAIGTTHWYNTIGE